MAARATVTSKTTTLHVHHAFLFISLPSQHDYDLKWLNFKFFFEDWNGKAINSTISVWTQTRPPLFSSNINSLLLCNWATWDNREMVWKDAESIFQRGFHGRRRCRIVGQRGRRRLRKRHLKSESRYLKLYCAYSISFNSWNGGKFLWSWILKDCIKVQEKKKKMAVIFGFPS